MTAFIASPLRDLDPLWPRSASPSFRLLFGATQGVVVELGDRGQHTGQQPGVVDRFGHRADRNAKLMKERLYHCEVVDVPGEPGDVVDEDELDLLSIGATEREELQKLRSVSRHCGLAGVGELLDHLVAFALAVFPAGPNL